MAEYNSNYTQGSGNNQSYNNNQGYRDNNPSAYSVDIVMVIDATGSMSPLLDMVKNNALGFYGDLKREMEKKDKYVSQLRVRVILYRDYVADHEDAMLMTDFYTLPEQENEFRDVFADIVAQGGGDIPEDGLEALAYAIKSNWTKAAGKKRHVIVLWTDAPAHELGFGKGEPNYPKSGMAKDFDELTEWWDSMEETSKRLLLFAPEDESWTDVSDLWDNTVFLPSAAGRGMEDHTYQAILDAISGSI